MRAFFRSGDTQRVIVLVMVVLLVLSLVLPALVMLV